MHLFIIGGSGRTGKLATAEALRRGHTVTALVRKGSSLDQQPGLTITSGTPLSKSDVDQVFENANSPITAVLVTLNAPRESDNPFAKPIAPPGMMAEAHTNVLAAMKAHNVSRIVTMSACGTGDSFLNLSILLRLLFRYSNMSYAFQDHDKVDGIIKSTAGVDWVLVRPMMLKDGDSLPIKDWGDQGLGVGLTANITRKSVASLLLDALDGTQWVGRTPVVSN